MEEEEIGVTQEIGRWYKVRIRVLSVKMREKPRDGLRVKGDQIGETENQLHGIMIRGMTLRQQHHTDVSLRGKPKSRLHREGDQKLNLKGELADLSNFHLIT